MKENVCAYDKRDTVTGRKREIKGVKKKDFFKNLCHSLSLFFFVFFLSVH